MPVLCSLKKPKVPLFQRFTQKGNIQSSFCTVKDLLMNTYGEDGLRTLVTVYEPKEDEKTKALPAEMRKKPTRFNVVWSVSGPEDPIIDWIKAAEENVKQQMEKADLEVSTFQTSLVYEDNKKRTGEIIGFKCTVDFDPKRYDRIQTVGLLDVEDGKIKSWRDADSIEQGVEQMIEGAKGYCILHVAGAFLSAGRVFNNLCARQVFLDEKSIELAAGDPEIDGVRMSDLKQTKPEPTTGKRQREEAEEEEQKKPKAASPPAPVTPEKQEKVVEYTDGDGNVLYTSTEPI